MKPQLLALALSTLLHQSVALAHPWHTSFAEVSWNDAGDTLQVALRVLPEDLETALTWRSGKTVVLADNPEQRGLALDYLEDHFLLHSESGEVFRPDNLLGMEIAYEASWLYFTIPVSAERRLHLHNSVLMDVEGSQANRVQPLWAGPQETLLFTSARPEQSLWQGH